MQIAIKIIKTVDGKIAFDKINIICIKNDLQANVYACKRSGLINPKIETLSFLIFFISCIKRLHFLFHITWLMWWTLDDESKCTFFILQDVPTSSFTMGILCFDPSWPHRSLPILRIRLFVCRFVCFIDHWCLWFWQWRWWWRRWWLWWWGHQMSNLIHVAFWDSDWLRFATCCLY